MENKEIYIDGVDVSECIYYEDGKCLNDEMVQCSCKKVAVCYYKEYKRKEQECERLKSDYFTVIQQRNIAEQQLDQLKAENEELTSKCSQLEEEIKDWQKEVERIQFIGSYGIMDEVKKNTKLEQTLTEIKKIADNYTKRNYADFKFALQQILQKISEVEE